MKVLLTGATGFVGTRVIKALHKRGHTSVVLTQDSRRAAVRLPHSTQIYSWDPKKRIFPEKALRDVQAVIHLAGENIADGRWTTSKKDRIRDSRIEPTRILVEALERSRVRPEVLVSASAIGIYGDRGDEILKENSEKGTGFLAEVCHHWEHEVSKACDLGVRSVMLRIGVVLGHGGGAIKKMLPPFRMALGGNLGNGRQWMSWIHVDDLADMFVHAIENRDLEGPINAVSPHPVTNGIFTATLAKVLNRPVFLPVPGLALKLLLGEMSQILLHSQCVSSNKICKAGFEFRYPDLKQALSEIVGHTRHEFEMEQWLPQPPEKTFAFFKQCENLRLLTPDFVQLKTVEPSTEIVREGTTIDYRMSLHGFPFSWQSQVTDWQPNQKFTDIQTKGPYSFWSHTHEFEEKEGGTLVKDHVVYEVPMGVPGELLVHDFVRKDLEEIFSFRREKMKELLT